LDLLAIIGIGVGLSMDCFAISVATGIAVKRLPILHAVRIALFFGGFQALMPVAGFYLGRGVADLVAGWDHWVVFAVLAVIGGRMIWESLKTDAGKEPANILNLFTLFVLSLATSLDALAIGFSFAFIRSTILVPVVIIGVVTFVVSMAGMAVGERLGHFFEKRIEIVGGLVLIAIGAKILLEHLL
jgi:putative Mn2+ efflux pump MntP